VKTVSANSDLAVFGPLLQPPGNWTSETSPYLRYSQQKWSSPKNLPLSVLNILWGSEFLVCGRFSYDANCFYDPCRYGLLLLTATEKPSNTNQTPRRMMILIDPIWHILHVNSSSRAAPTGDTHRVYVRDGSRSCSTYIIYPWTLLRFYVIMDRAFHLR
jgi:hypothetical protein